MNELEQLEYYVQNQLESAKQRIANNPYNGQHFEGMACQCNIILREIAKMKNKEN